MSNVKSNLFFLLAVLIHVSQVHSLSVVRSRSNMAIFNGYDVDQRKIIYSNSDKAEWKNLDGLIQRGGLENKALLCGMGSGAWIAYPAGDYKTSENAQFVWILFGETCIAGDHINSAQSIGHLTKEFNGVITFTEPMFASEPTLLSANNTESVSGVKSLITVTEFLQIHRVSSQQTGNSWTVEGDGKKFCIVDKSINVRTRKVSLDLEICVIPDIPTQLGIKDATVKMGCEQDDFQDPKIALDRCFNRPGAFRVLNNDITTDTLKPYCGGEDRDQPTHMLAIVFSYRLTGWLDVEQYFTLDINGKRPPNEISIRLKLLNNFFEIFKNSCPSLSHEYIDIVRLVFLMHLQAIWKEAPSVLKDRNDTRFDWRSADSYLQNCLSARLANPEVAPPEEVICTRQRPWHSSPKPEEEALALDLFLQGDNLDHIIEHVWLMLNQVSPYCASTTGYVDNTWVDFVNLFRRQVLLPLVQQWVDPGHFQAMYVHMFNGYSLDDGKRQVINCIQQIISQTPNMDPIDRPSAAAKEFLSVSKKRPPVNLNTDKKSKEKPAKKKRYIVKQVSRIGRESRH